MSSVDPINDNYSPSSNPTAPAGDSGRGDYQAPEYDSAGLLESQVNDINTLTNKDNDLMKDANTKGMQYANSRGLLNSSMAAGATEAERLNVVMPIVQQNAQTRGQADLQGREFEYNAGENSLNRAQDLTLQENDQGFQAGESALNRDQDLTIQERDQAFQGGENALNRDQDLTIQENELGFRGDQAALDRSQQTDVLNLEYARKADLVNIEQAWNGFMSDNKNAADFYRQSQEALGDILSSDLTDDQLNAALNEMLGYTANGVKVIGSIEAGLNYLQDLSGFSPSNGGFNYDGAGAGPSGYTGGTGPNFSQGGTDAGLLSEAPSADPSPGRGYSGDVDAAVIANVIENPVFDYGGSSTARTSSPRTSSPNADLTPGPDVTDGYNPPAIQNFDYSSYNDITPQGVQWGAFSYAAQKGYKDINLLLQDFNNNPEVRKGVLDAAFKNTADPTKYAQLYSQRSGMPPESMAKSYAPFSGAFMNGIGAPGINGADTDWATQSGNAQNYYFQ